MHSDAMTNIQTIRAIVQLEMKKKGFSRRSLSKAANLSETAVRDLLTRTNNPGTDTLCRVAKALEMPVDALMGLRPPMGQLADFEASHENLGRASMLCTTELLARLDAADVSRRDVAACLGVDISAVTRMYAGQRQLKLDEAKKLVDLFGLVEVSPPPGPLSLPVTRMLVLYAADALGFRLDPADPGVEEVAHDFRSFLRAATDPLLKDNVDAMAGYLKRMRDARSSVNP